MSLTEEKTLLKSVVTSINETEKLSFEVKDNNIQSYFKDFNNCFHLDELIYSYDSEEFIVFRKSLLDLWKHEDIIRKRIIPILLVMYKKTREMANNYLSEIDLNNYMM